MFSSTSAIALAAVLAVLGLATAPVERRLFRQALSTRAKLSAYGALMLLLWALTIAAIAIQGWPALSHGPAPLQSWLPAPALTGAALGLAAAVYLGLNLMPLLQSLRGERWRQAYAAAMRRQGAAFPGMTPDTRLECAAFVLVSLTAGFCEEALFRGFLIGFLHEGPPHLAVIAALGVSSLIFGINHAYQGARGVLVTAIAGLALGLVFLLTGRLWPAIALHALIDLQTAYVLWPGRKPTAGLAATIAAPASGS